MPDSSAHTSRPCCEAAPQLLLRGVMQFNRGEYDPSHETLEELWMADERPIRRLYQGILQIAVALNHLRRGNRRGAVALLATARQKLSGLADICMQVDVAALRTDAEQLHNRLEACASQGPKACGEELFFKIHLHPHKTREEVGEKSPLPPRSH